MRHNINTKTLATCFAAYGQTVHTSFDCTPHASCIDRCKPYEERHCKQKPDLIKTKWHRLNFLVRLRMK